MHRTRVPKLSSFTRASYFSPGRPCGHLRTAYFLVAGSLCSARLKVGPSRRPFPWTAGQRLWSVWDSGAFLGTLGTKLGDSDAAEVYAAEVAEGPLAVKPSPATHAISTL